MPTKKIIAIGGGEIGRPGFPVETTAIDEEIIKLSGKKQPKLLLLPTASGDAPLYFAVAKKHFGKRLGAKVDVLYLINAQLTKKQISDKILSADIIYVGGGDTLKMIKVWRKVGVDKLLKKAWERGIVMSGVSAGAICWFRFGQSDTLKFAKANAPYVKVNGLNFLNALCVPHFDFEKERQSDIKRMMKNTLGTAVALDNCSALEVIDDKFKMITSKRTAKAYKIFWHKNKYYKEEIENNKEFRLLLELTNKFHKLS